MKYTTNLPKRIHFIGIAGVATGALAIALKDAGVRVTGSDKGIFPPMSTELTARGISYYTGWHPERMLEQGKPDIVIIGTASGSQNPETLKARELGIPELSFAQAIGRYLTRGNSIVCAGTWGKTSSSALLAHIFSQAELEPSYMFGGVSQNKDFPSARYSESDWSILEGDEYKSSPIDTTAKFFYYKPSHILLSAVSWDHADLYPTEQDFDNTFARLIQSIPSDPSNNPRIVVCADNTKAITLVKDNTKSKYITYGTKGDIWFDNVIESEDGIDFKVHINEEIFDIHSPLLGQFQAENITGCIAMAGLCDIPIATIIKSISSFTGIKRRMEKRYKGQVTVIDDIAHSPEKARRVIETLKRMYIDKKIYVVFEPNIGGREFKSGDKYSGAFNQADLVIIPRLTQLKTGSEIGTMDGQNLADVIAKTQPFTKYIDDDETVVRYLTEKTEQGDIIAFLGSHGFRNMIEDTINQLRDKSEVLH